MPTQPEARISRKIVKELNARGFYAFKVHGSEYQPAGLPDILACVNGRYVGLEVKRPETRSDVSPTQHYVHSKIRRSGGAVAVVVSVEEALEFVREVTESSERGSHRQTGV